MKPDVAVPAAEAMKVAYTTILKDLVAKATDDGDREHIERALARLEKDEVDLPRYFPRRQ